MEIIRDKYENILEAFVSNTHRQKGTAECAHSTDFFIRDRTVSKIKQIQAKYRKVLETGQQSGGGGIVARFYDLCSEIWSGHQQWNLFNLV